MQLYEIVIAPSRGDSLWSLMQAWWNVNQKRHSSVNREITLHILQQDSSDWTSSAVKKNDTQALSYL